MAQLINSVTPLGDARAGLAAHFDLTFGKAVEKATAPAYERLREKIPGIEWPLLAPLIFQINHLKKQKHAVILAHNFQAPQIFWGVADITGDTLKLAAAAGRVDEDIIVQCGVSFMAETSKILNPQKTVLIPDSRAGCSLAASITADDVLAMKAQYPGVPVVTHLNTSAAVKAVSDACCTSANGLEIVEAMPADTVIMVPDQFLARNIAKRTAKKIVTWNGACEVHETFTAADIAELRAAYPGASIIAHPQCPPEVIAAVDYAGATEGMIGWIKAQKPPRVVMVTECSMSDNVAAETPGTEFLRGCNICPHMKRITLENILWSLHTLTEEVVVAPELVEPAAAAIRRMLDLSPAP